jgi:hypothetical protein
MKNNRTLPRPYCIPVSPVGKLKKKINWLRVFVAVNFIVNGYMIWCVNDLYKLCYDTASANVFLAKVFTFVYHLAEKGIHL